MCEENTTARAPSAGDVDDLLEELTARDRVEARDRLVEDQEVGAVAECEQNRQLLALADRHPLDALAEVELPLAREPRDERVVPARIEGCDHSDLVGGGELGSRARLVAARTRAAPWPRPVGDSSRDRTARRRRRSAA
jgi:hypothetical protein